MRKVWRYCIHICSLHIGKCTATPQFKCPLYLSVYYLSIFYAFFSFDLSSFLHALLNKVSILFSMFYFPIKESLESFCDKKLFVLTLWLKLCINEKMNRSFYLTHQHICCNKDRITKRKIHIKQYYIFHTNHDLVEINFWLSFALFCF